MNETTTRLIAGTLALVILAGSRSLLGAEPAQSESPIQRIYIIHFSHTDVGFTDMPGVCRDLQQDYLDIAIDGALATMSQPAGRQFHWT